jgi:hypothetical protein
MSHSDLEQEIAAFILSHGVTRCPTACVVRTQATPNSADREALQRRAAEDEIRRQQRRTPKALLFGRKSFSSRKNDG